MRVLLVDHDSTALETITRAIRGVLELDCVTSKADALLLLRQNTYDVLIACERAEDGSGLDLLGRTTRTAVPLKRIFAAAPERLQLLGPRLAPFKVQRTINYPIDLEELWLAIAQVTSGPNDETDGTIERVVLDERGIPSTGTVPRSPIPPRPPAPLSAVAPPPTAPMASTSASGRYATARVPQPTPEPPLRPPPPPRAAPTSAPGARPATVPVQRRAAPPAQPAPPVPLPPMTAAEPFPAWTPESPTEDEFAEIAAQARFGVQQKTVDDAARRKRQRVLVACGITAVVAVAIVMLLEKFYDPAAIARKEAIAQEVARMAEQQKTTDKLTLIEIDIENAIMSNDFDKARRELAELNAQSPDHPRLDFLRKSIDRAEELARLSPQGDAEKVQGPAQAAVLPSAERTTNRPRTPERPPARVPPERQAPRPAERTVASRPSGGSASPSSRTYGAPVNDTPREASIPLDAPINSAPTYTTRRPDNSFPGRTVEASDAGVGRSTPPAAPLAKPPVSQAPVIQPATNSAAANGVQPAPANASGSAVAPMPSAAPPAAAPAANVVPAKITKRVMPLAPRGVSSKTTGYVVVSFNIGTNGRVSDVQIVESQPQGVFDDSAKEAVRRWVYEPRKENGTAVASPGRAKLVFDGSIAQ